MCDNARDEAAKKWFDSLALQHPGDAEGVEGYRKIVEGSFAEGWDQAMKRRLGDGVHKMLDLSTAHMPESQPDFGELRVVEHEYGFVVFTSPAEEEEDDEFNRVPEWLRSIHKRAVELDCILVNFDRDADVVDVFERWEW